MYRFMLAVAAASFGIAASAQAQRQQPVVHHSSRWVINGHTTMAMGANVEDDFNQIKTASGLGAGFEVGYRVTPRLLAYAGLDINKQPVDMADAGPDLERELIAYCREHLADVKCPRTVDFLAELPRHPTGKLYKRLLKDQYWEGHESRIV